MALSIKKTTQKHNMNLFKDIYRGAGYIKGYGHHPGNSIVLTSILLGALVGAQTDTWDGVIGGAFLVAVVVVPIWALTCVCRARTYQQNLSKSLNLSSKKY